jgi:hypothetical protein
VIAGHFGFAAAVKARETRVPLWALMIATVFLDIVFVPLFLAGIEPIVPIGKGGYGEGYIHADYTHSLVGALLLSVLFGAIFAIFWSRRTAIILGAVVFSHWLLDLPMHRADMQLFPHWGPMLGFGLWRWPALSVVIELALVLLGAFLYYRASKSKLIASLLALFGIVVLALNLAGQ